MHVKPPVIKICPQCGVEFRRPPSLARTKFCGADCWHAHHAAREKVCQQCGKAFRRHGAGRNQGTGKIFCSPTCSSQALRQRVEWRCKDCGRVELRTPFNARRGLRCAECGAAYRSARLKGRPLPHVVDAAVRTKWLEALRTPEHRRRLSALSLGREMETDLTRRNSPRHFKALHFTVRSPAGVPYVVDNLCAFVRGHPELFDPEDVVNRSPKRASYQSRATHGLRKLRSVVGTRLSWKGWTLTFGTRDELGRQAVGKEALESYETN